MNRESNEVSIVPGVTLLSALSHLNYKAWFAVAEYVDNAVQSSHANQAVLQELEPSFRLRVSVDIQGGEDARIIIRDNAAGIARQDFPRAFRTAAVPPDRSGLSEFGMGMKSASSWFAKKWTVRTSPIGDPHTYQITFDMDEILATERETVQVLSEPAEAEVHFTEITLVNLHKPIAGRTKAKIRTHLTDIYRILIREGELNLVLDGSPIVPVERTVLEAPYFKNPGSELMTWKKEIEFCFGAGYSVSGFAALLETGDSSGAGFALYRRGRAIQGTGDEGYRPNEIFGSGNSFRHQRLFGELQLSGFSVSHTEVCQGSETVR